MVAIRVCIDSNWPINGVSLRNLIGKLTFGVPIFHGRWSLSWLMHFFLRSYVASYSAIR